MLKRIIIFFLIWRFWLFLPLYLSFQFLAYRPGYEYTSPQHFIVPGSPINHFLLSPWGNFDGINYLLIAGEGYNVNAGFFPLFPLILRSAWAIWGETAPFALRPYLISITLTSLFFILSLMFLHRLIRLDYSSKVAMRSLIFLLVFPTAFFFVTIYSESLFLLLTLASFYFARQRRWWWAGVAGLLLTVTRPVGLAILPALLVELILTQHHRLASGWSIWIRKALPLFFIPAGLMAYLWFNWIKWGNPLFFILAQGNFLNNRSVGAIVWLPQTLVRYFRILLTIPLGQYEWWVAILELVAFLFTAFGLYLGWKKKLRLSYLIFALVCFLIPTATGTFTGLPRYIITLFPLYLVLALGKSRPLTNFTMMLFTILQSVLLMLFSRGYFVA